VNAAVAALGRGGELRIEEICAASGASVGTIYHHFGNRAGLVAAAEASLLDGFFEWLRGALTGALSKAERKGKRGLGKKRFATAMAVGLSGFLSAHPTGLELTRRLLTAERLHQELGEFLPTSLGVDGSAALAAMIGVAFYELRAPSPGGLGHEAAWRDSMMRIVVAF